MEAWQENQLLGQAEAARQSGDLGAALRILRGLVEGNPSHAEARRGLALAMSSVGDQGGAVEHMRMALAARPSDPGWQFEMGYVLECAGHLEEAREAYGRAGEMNPRDARCPARIAMLGRRLRDEEGARLAAERALALDPNEPCALLALSQDSVKRGLLDEGEKYARRLMAVGREAQVRASALHELGKIQERQGRLREAFESHMNANKLKLGTPEARVALRTKALMHFVGYVGHGDGPDRYRAWGAREYGDGIPPPVVLTGFPRSGTTMAQQILGAHPGVATADERPLCVEVRKELDTMLGDDAGFRPLLEVLDGLSDEEVGRLRAVYRRHLEESIPEGMRDRVLVDKHPLRTLDVGLMNRILPETRVIFMVRDPRDVCLSALFQDFVVNAGMVRFFSPQLCAEWYAKVMGFWLKIRPMLALRVLEVRYEDLVSDFDTWGPRVVEFAGVDWDDRVRAFHEPASQRVVRSASFEAVTEPLHTRAIGRWKRYAEQMGPMLERLEPFVEALGYEPTSPGGGGGVA